MSRKREHGRIISVESMTRGDALAEDVAAGATSITVEDAGDFDEDGGWLTIGGQVIEFTECDDDTGVILLAAPLTAAAEQGDPVQVWSDLYEEVIEYQQALVELDGEYDNPDPVVAEVAEGVGELPEGDRGWAGESCTLKRVAEDEWEVVAVGGRSRKSQAIRFEDGDGRAITQAEVDAGEVVLSLSHRPIDEALTCVLAGAPQRPTNWTIDYAAKTLTIPLSGWEQAGMVLWVHYAYRKGVVTAPLAIDPQAWDQAVAALSPWAWYKLDDNATDSSGNARTASATAWGFPAWGQPSLLPAGTGSSGQMSAGTGIVTPTFQWPSSGVAIAFTYKGSADANTNPLGYFFYHASNFHLARVTATDTIQFCSTDTGVPRTAIGDGQSHLVVVNIEVGSRSLDIDGVTVWSDTGSPGGAGANQLFWGYGAGASGYRMDGGYDELVMFNRALTATERESLADGWGFTA